VIWGHSGDDGGGNAFVAYSPDGENPDGTVGTWTEFHPNKLPGEANHNAMQIHPISDRILVSLHARDSLAAMDPAYPGSAITTVPSQGKKPRLSEYAALEYSAGTESFVYFSAAGGADVYAIDWDDGVANWRVVSAPGSMDPIADAAIQTRHKISQSHTFGRFRVAHFDRCDLALLVRHVDSPVYAMRLSR